jgi:cell wall-associated NlpC family hydrolase
MAQLGDLQVKAKPSTVIPVLLIGIGGYLAWFGAKYWRGTGEAVWPSFPVKGVLQGKGLPAPEPAASTDAQLAGYEQAASGAIAVPGAGVGKGASGQAIASDALRYQGAPYKWGGAKPDGWDCSGFVNYVIGHDMGMRIPGG